MQYLDDDMDELWRKAADEYPLNTEGADWSKVAKGLGVPATEERPDRRRYLWLLLLLLLPWVCLEYRQQQESGTAGRNGSSETASPREQRATSGNSAHASGANGGAGQLPSGEVAQRPELTPGNTVNTNPGSGSAARRSDAAPSATAAAVPAATTSAAKRATTKEEIALAATNQTATTSNPQQPGRRVKVRDLAITAAPSLVSAQPRLAAKKRIGGKNASGGLASRRAKSVYPAIDPSIKPDSAGTVAFAPAPLRAAPMPAVSDTAVTAQKTILPPSADTTVTPEVKKKQPASTPKRHFYAGVIAGAGLTTVNGQAVRKPGVDLGVVLGYAFSKYVVAEAGVLYSRKHYYSRGDLASIPYTPPAYVYLSDVSGDCRMIEIPVSVQVHFRHRARGNWFAGAGLSSYLMQKEIYDYTYKNTMYPGEYSTSYTYNHATRDWCSQLQLSAGYRLNLPRGMHLRVEPYVQLPLGNAGYGRLPLTSAGLRLGITKFLF